ncbi:uncharacterized protein LOC143175332 [Nomia melanderi]|uniref:uncharacterized protein LOC143175332 n=1 Tax=Nomia melanderi TaxID=2448451 RepID=UPI003FCE31D7
MEYEMDHERDNVQVFTNNEDTVKTDRPRTERTSGEDIEAAEDAESKRKRKCQVESRIGTSVENVSDRGMDIERVREKSLYVTESGHCDVSATKSTTSYLEGQRQGNRFSETCKCQVEMKVGRATENDPSVENNTPWTTLEVPSDTERGREGASTEKRTNSNTRRPRRIFTSLEVFECQRNSEVCTSTDNASGNERDTPRAIQRGSRDTNRGRGSLPTIERTGTNSARLRVENTILEVHRQQPNSEIGVSVENEAGQSIGLIQTTETIRGEQEEVIEEETTEEEDKILIKVPMEEVQYCGFQRCQQRNVGFLNLTDLNRHYKGQHNSKDIAWQCRKCGKEFPGLHNCRCHIPKCRQQVEAQELQHICEKCSQQFHTARGLATHERHRHPEVRNRKRQEENDRHKGRPGRRNYVWTEEEIEKLIALNQEFAGEKRPNVEIRKRMPSKTMKQISDKRRELNNQARRVQHESVIEEEGQIATNENVEDESREQEVEHQQENSTPLLPNLEIEDIDDIVDQTWREQISRAIKKVSLHRKDELHKITKELDEIFYKIEEGEDAPSLIDQWINNSFNPTILEEEKNERTEKRQDQRERENKASRINTKKNNHNRRAKFRFARCQGLYEKCPKKLIDVAISGDFSVLDEKKELPAEEEIKTLYEQVWGQKGPKVTSKKEHPEASSLLSACPPFTEEEILKRIRKVKNNTAGGPDKIRKTHLRKKSIGKTLAKLFNMLVLTGHYPTPWKMNRTTLLPKPNKDPKDARNWRPITIGSLVARIFSGTLDQRIRGITTLSERQKGFIQEDGCKNNIRMVETIASRMKVEKGGVISVMDISKAFDTIPHSALEPRLREKGIPTHIIQLINNMYIDCRTVIKTKSKQGIEIEIQRGVKQGDPLSPLLFNIMMDEIIEDISRNTKGIEINGKRVAVLAFADDLIIIGRDREDAQEQLQILDQKLTELGMELATEKCLTFEIVGKKKTWYAKNPELKIKNKELPYASPEHTFRYLGVDITPWNNVHCEGTTQEIVQSIRNVARMKLKPHQKMDLIQRYLLPHFLHKLIAWAPQNATLKELDHNIKQEVKKILHLTPSTTDGLIYTTKLHGGLGLPRLEHLVKLAVIKHALKTEEYNDAALKEAILEENVQKKLKGYANSLRINWPTSLQELQAAKKRLRRENTDRWQQLISQGQGVEYFREDKIGNSWLANPNLLKPSRYIDALKLRTNTFGNRTTLHRAKLNEDVRCRKCKAQPETLGHIIGGCISVKPMRSRRHDEIKDLITKIAGRSCAVFPEPTVRVGGNLLKPDLVIKDQEKLIVVDVTVRYEVGGSLRRAYTEKVEKYKEAAQSIKERLGCNTAEVLPIVVGARGAMPNKTVKNLKTLKFQEKDLMTVSMIALRSSIEIANAFIDYDNII